jgi:plastocyanin
MKKTVYGLMIVGFALSAVAGTVSGKVSGALGKSVVYIEGVQGKTPAAPEKPPVMDQHGLQFQPHVLVVPVGTTVEFLNSDKVAHNVFWPSVSGNKRLSHNMGTWPTGEKRSFKFDTPGIVTLLCNVHPEMAGYIVVTPTPYYAETDAAGNYKIENLPDGQYTVTAWHEGTKPQSKQIALAGQGQADFTLSK